MRRVGKADCARLWAHYAGMRRRAAGKEMYAVEIVPVRDARRREHHVAAGELLKAEFLVNVFDAHRLSALDLLRVAELEPSLHVAVHAGERRRREHAFRRAADAEQKIDAGLGLGGGDRRRDVAVADEAD